MITVLHFIIYDSFFRSVSGFICNFHPYLRSENMSSFSNRNVRTVHSVSRSQPPEIPGRWNNPEDLREQNIPENTEMQNTKAEHINNK
uniref:Bm9039 n=1 Tax=Brugia malayi TaxID=6279 RepID=A0A1I9GCY7_BRUMA|nr:Bm9039 [Brugia malayi]